MYSFERYQIESAIGAYKSGNYMQPVERKPFRSTSSQWDFIIRFVCAGCGRTLGRYEINKHFAYCHHCRCFLFPETVSDVVKEFDNN